MTFKEAFEKANRITKEKGINGVIYMYYGLFSYTNGNIATDCTLSVNDISCRADCWENVIALFEAKVNNTNPDLVFNAAP
jgi:hypothetical protein